MPGLTAPVPTLDAAIARPTLQPVSAAVLRAAGMVRAAGTPQVSAAVQTQETRVGNAPTVHESLTQLADDTAGLRDISALSKTFDGMGSAVSAAPAGQAAVETASPGPSAQTQAARKPLRLLIAGPPGAGKSTHAKRLAKELGIAHISVGQLLRDYALQHPEIAAKMNTGDLVDTQLVMKVVRERLAQRDAKENGFIFDGFPRREVELKALNELLGQGQTFDAMIYLDAPKAELLDRILARGRADDSAPIFANRMNVYETQTRPVIDQLKVKVPVIAPQNSGLGIEAVYEKLMTGFRSWLAR
ncbi:MAG TPA: hypothetical protein DD417_12235 [Elusimicrobia bacterium]|nr:hypothetical protein [Elusimicrobiota bacterium]